MLLLSLFEIYEQRKQVSEHESSSVSEKMTRIRKREVDGGDECDESKKGTQRSRSDSQFCRLTPRIS